MFTLKSFASFAVAKERSRYLPSCQYRTVCGLRGFFPLMITDIAQAP